MTTPAGQLLISGTAAVVGSASPPSPKNVAAQLDETLTNVESLIQRRARRRHKGTRRGSLLKVYVRDANDAPLVVAKLAEAMRDTDESSCFAADAAAASCSSKSTACTPEARSA